METGRIVRMVAAFVLVWSTARAETATAKLPVRVYDTAGLKPAVLDQVLTGAASVFMHSGVAVTWTDCRRAAATCRLPLATGELAVRVVSVRLPRGYRGDAPLGDALIDTQRRTGVLGTVYYDRVAWLSRAIGIDLATLLSRTVAHEIGHLLAGTTHHDATGLMRPVWTPDELRRKRAADWVLARDETGLLK